jgi:ABC-type transport system involved in multi-copper enzyme maturation permease subunit
MLNLIVKDFLLLKKWLKFQLGVWLFFMMQANGFGVPFLVISLVMASIPISIDEKNKTEGLYISLPVKRSTVVIARYLYTVVIIAVVIAVTYFSSRGIHMLFPENFKKVVPFDSLLGAQLPVIFFMSLVFPLFFRYSSHFDTDIRSIAISLSVIFGVIIAFYVITTNLGFDPFSVDLIYISLGMCVLMLISLGISILIYRRREF